MLSTERSPTRRTWRPQLMAIPIRFTKTDLTALAILKDCLGTADTTKTVQAALGATITMVQSLMKSQGFTTSQEFRAWWVMQQAFANATSQVGGTTDAQTSSGASLDAGAVTAGSMGDTNAPSETTVQNVSEGSGLDPRA